MKNCALCLEQEADKKNTHYLTDSIIKTCLNFEGSNIRERGLSFTFETKKPFIDMVFQRATPVEVITGILNREITDEERQAAMKNSFAVDNIFCSRCEAIFTDIENEFSKKILPMFRQRDLTDMDQLFIQEVKVARLFFLIQVWRSSVCNTILKIDEAVKEELRLCILNYKQIGVQDLKKYPLSITYLQTLGGKEAYTHNSVGYASGDNPYVIFFNDFIIQFYDDFKLLKYDNFMNLNDKQDYASFVNYNESEFLVKVFSDEKRLGFFRNILKSESENKLNYYSNLFVTYYIRKHNSLPGKKMIEKFRVGLVSQPFSFNNYSEEKILDFIEKFI